ncbi:hypothetical protein HDU83_007109 [Entophlyctis luteolus]|nr:hypothetical protein HDU83_007109 [Entophlyctis luteolus]
MCKYGEVEEVKVCDNIGDHLLGNVYVMFVSEEDAGNAVDALNKRFYAGRPVYAELSPVTDFGEACCRQYENSECNRGGLCNFMHLKTVSRALSRELYEAQRLSLKILKGGSGGSGGSRELLDRDRDYRVLDRNWDRERDRSLSLFEVSRTWRHGAMLALVSETTTIEGGLLQPQSIAEIAKNGSFRKFPNHTIPVTRPLHPALEMSRISVSITQHQYLNVDEDGDIFGETEADSMEMGRLNLQHEKIRLLQEIQDALSYEDAANHLKLVRFRSNNGQISQRFVVGELGLTRGRMETSLLEEGNCLTLCLVGETIGVDFGQIVRCFDSESRGTLVTLVSMISATAYYRLRTCQ